MATQDWNSSYEGVPADGDNISEGANRIRNLKRDIRERIEKDHYMDVAGTQADHGEHSKVTFHEPIATPTAVADKGFLYTKDVGGKAELHFEDEDGNEVQLTSVGTVDPYGFIADTSTIPFYQAAPPTGWTPVALNDYMLRVVTSGTTGGGTGGTDSPINFSHTHAGPSHTHEMPFGMTGGQIGYNSTPIFGSSANIFSANAQTSSGGASTNVYTMLTKSSGNGTTGSANFTPKYADLVIATKD